MVTSRKHDSLLAESDTMASRPDGVLQRHPVPERLSPLADGSGREEQHGGKDRVRATFAISARCSSGAFPEVDEFDRHVERIRR